MINLSERTWADGGGDLTLLPQGSVKSSGLASDLLAQSST